MRPKLKNKELKNLMGQAIGFIRGTNRKKHTDRPSKWNSRGGGMGKHYSAGHSPQHPRVKAQNMWEYRRNQEEEMKRQEAKKPRMYTSIRELFN